MAEAAFFALTMTTTSALAAAEAITRPARTRALAREFESILMTVPTSENDVDGQADDVDGALEAGLHVPEETRALRIHVVVLELHGHRIRGVPTHAQRSGGLLVAGDQCIHTERKWDQRTHARDHVAR